MKLSEKKSQELYNAVHDRIMAARVQIAKMLKQSAFGDQIDDILSDLSKEGPQAAVDCFVTPKVKGSKTADESFTDFRDEWFAQYPILALSFSGVDGKMLNKIIKITRTFLIGKGKDTTRERMLNAYRYVIAYVKRDHHFCDGKPLTTWGGQYASILDEIHNGRKKENYNARTSAQRFVNNL